MSDRVLQEFYCAESGGGCDGYMRVRVNMALNGVFEIICPKCGHGHRRTLKKGVLTEAGRFKGEVLEQLCPTIASWSHDAHHPESKRRAGTRKERDAVVIEESRQEKQARRLLEERRFEIHGDQR